MRRTFDQGKLNELASSIAHFGLQNPPVARRENGQWMLVSGERRMRAIEQLVVKNIAFTCGDIRIPPGSIPITTFGEIDPLHALELELAENVIRVDLPFIEHIEAVNRLHDLRKAQNPTQTLRATASEIQGSPAEGQQITNVSTAIALKPFLDDPEVRKATSFKEAEKIVRKRLLAEKRADLAASFNPAASPHQLYKGRCEDLLPIITPNIAVFITDPPYGVGADEFGSQASTEHAYVDDEASALKRYDFLAGEFARLASPAGAHAYLFLDIRHFASITGMFELAGWRVWPTPLIWAKNRGMLPWPEHGPRRMYECILFAIKGNRRVNLIKSDVIPIPAEAEDHGAAKPVALYIDLLSRSALPGDIILDACAGSGPIFPAADAQSCVAIGIEPNDAYANICAERIKSLSIDI
jgi:DNA modification methylase